MCIIIHDNCSETETEAETERETERDRDRQRQTERQTEHSCINYETSLAKAYVTVI